MMPMSPFAAGVAPATLHNLKYGEPVLVSANLGANLVAGHSDRADGVSAIPVGVQWDDLQLQTRQAGARTPAEASRYLTKQALGWMADNPGRTLALLGKKALPRQLPDRVGFGDEMEAISYAAELGPVWRYTPGALEWLAEQVG